MPTPTTARANLALLLLCACAASPDAALPDLPAQVAEGPSGDVLPDGPHGFAVRFELRRLHDGGRALAVPHLTVRPGQTGAITVEHQLAYLAGAEWSRAGDVVVGDPRVDVARDGLRVDVLVEDGPDARTARLGFRVRFAALERPLPEHDVRPETDGGVVGLQFPRTRRSELLGAVDVALGRRTLLGHLPAQDAGDVVVYGTVRPVALDPRADGDEPLPDGSAFDGDTFDPVLPETLARARTSSRGGMVRARVVRRCAAGPVETLSPAVGLRTSITPGVRLSSGTTDRYLRGVRPSGGGDDRSWDTEIDEHASGLSLGVEDGDTLRVVWDAGPRWRERIVRGGFGAVRVREPLGAPLSASIPLDPGERSVPLGVLENGDVIALLVRYEPDEPAVADQTPANR